MKFETLEDDESAFNDLEAGCHKLLIGVKAHTIVLASLMATHPNYEQFQMHLTSALEGPGMRVLGSDMPAHDAELLRSIVEQLQ